MGNIAEIFVEIQPGQTERDAPRRAQQVRVVISQQIGRTIPQECLGSCIQKVGSPGSRGSRGPGVARRGGVRFWGRGEDVARSQILVLAEVGLPVEAAAGFGGAGCVSE